MSVRNHHRHAERRRRRRLGQALVETAIAAPLLVVLLLGGAQVGSIAYDQVSLDTAAREGARAGVAAPTSAVYSYVSSSAWYPGQNSYQCQAADFANGANPICVAVLNSAGYLDQTAFKNSPCTLGHACVTITVVPPGGLASFVGGPAGARLASAPQTLSNSASSPCNSGKQAEVDGLINFNGATPGLSATLTDSTPKDGTLTVAPASPNYQWCVTADNSVTSQTIVAQVGPVACGGYTGSVTIPVVNHGQLYSGEDITLAAEPACTTSTSTTTSSTSSSSSTSSTTTSTTVTSAQSSGPVTGCPTQPVSQFDTYYFKVTISYPAPIFVPFINVFFQTAPGLRTISTSVTYAIEPCTMTGPA